MSLSPLAEDGASLSLVGIEKNKLALRIQRAVVWVSVVFCFKVRRLSIPRVRRDFPLVRCSDFDVRCKEQMKK